MVMIALRTVGVLRLALGTIAIVATRPLMFGLRGRTVAAPVRDAEGRVWLQKQEGQGEEESRLTLAVSRRAEDDVPFRLLTRVDLRVSGRSREVNLGQALPGRFVPMALRAPFPARIDDRGRLIAQVRPGVWSLEIDARHEGAVASHL